MAWCERAGVLQAHPRSRGENDQNDLFVGATEGSSPLTRGKLIVAVDDGARAGLIPAHAGKTSYSSTRFHRYWAHPRSRGENDRMCLSPCQFPGSSPLTRGKPEYAHDCACVDGLIPAHAGKTVSGSINSPPAGAHPRSRGENQNANATLRDYRGSSPLTRGKRANVVSEKYQVVAHPRSRGENVLDAIAATRRWGSSPLTRGKPENLPSIA